MSDTKTDSTPPERARIETAAPAKRLDALPVLYLVGFVILASALIYMWRHPTLPRSAVQDSARVASLQQDSAAMRQAMDALAARLTALEGRPAPDLGPLDGRVAQLEKRPLPQPVDLGPLAGRLAELEKRPVPQPPDLAPLDGRVKALEERKPVDLGPLDARVQAVEARKPVDLGPLEARLAAQEKKEAEDAAGLSAKLDAAGQQAAALGPRLDQMDAQARAATASLAAVTQRAQQLGRVQAAGVALAAGQRLGEIPGAPPALARFAQEAPPTEAGLKLSFDAAAQAAMNVSQPAAAADKPLLDRMWSRAQQSVTVRQGDRVLVGDPISGVLARARTAVDAGDLAGAVQALGALGGAPKAAMADWVGRAQSLLDARAAVAEMARG